jgi:hypothetical protein
LPDLLQITTSAYLFKHFLERGKGDTPTTQIHDRSIPWLGTDTLILSGELQYELLSIIKCPMGVFD